MKIYNNNIISSHSKFFTCVMLICCFFVNYSCENHNDETLVKKEASVAMTGKWVLVKEQGYRVYGYKSDYASPWKSDTTKFIYTWSEKDDFVTMSIDSNYVCDVRITDKEKLYQGNNGQYKGFFFYSYQFAWNDGKYRILFPDFPDNNTFRYKTAPLSPSLFIIEGGYYNERTTYSFEYHYRLLAFYRKI